MAMVTAMVTVMAMALNRDSRNRAGKLFFLTLAVSCVALPAYSGEWKITPSVAVNETATDNVALSSNADKKSELVTDINPGIRIDGNGERVKLRFDYQLHQLIHARDSSRNRTQNSLNALGTVEAVENWLFVEASGMISQQSISAFGGATSTSVNTNDGSNTTETSTYRLSPYIKGALGGFADYQVRYNLSTTSSKSDSAFDSDSKEVVATLKGVTSLTSLGWSVDASSQTVDYSNRRSNESDRLRGVLTYQFDPQFRASVSAGRESNNYVSTDKETHTTKGVGLEWSPTERTLVSVNRESRFFGNSNSFSFSHRTGNTSWKYSESKDASAQPNQQSSTNLGSYYDLYFNLFASAIPDPVARATYVNAFLLSNGISPTAQLQGGFLSSGVSLQHRRNLSFALLGARNTVTFSAFQSESENLSQTVGTGLFVGDFGNVQRVEQRGASINWSHKLTGLSSLTGGYSITNSKGSGTSSVETDQKMLNINFTTQLGPKTNAGIGARRVVVDGSTNYTENALTGTLSHQF